MLEARPGGRDGLHHLPQVLPNLRSRPRWVSPGLLQATLSPARPPHLGPRPSWDTSARDVGHPAGRSITPAPELAFRAHVWGGSGGTTDLLLTGTRRFLSDLAARSTWGHIVVSGARLDCHTWRPPQDQRSQGMAAVPPLTLPPCCEPHLPPPHFLQRGRGWQSHSPILTARGLDTTKPCLEQDRK